MSVNMSKAPIRIFEGTAKPGEPYWRVMDAAASESGEPEIQFDGVISEWAFYEDDITPKKFKDDLYQIGKGGPVTVRINSPGGDVTAASLLRAILIDYPGRVTCRVDGLCASAATVVAVSGDRVLMQDTAFWMIHDPWTVAIGGVEDLKAVIELLKTVKDGIVAAYTSRSNLGAERIGKLMTDETWMTAAEAREYGFVDQVVAANPNKAGLRPGQNAAMLNGLRTYRNLPADLRALLEQPTAEAPANNPLADRLRAEAKLLA